MSPLSARSGVGERAEPGEIDAAPSNIGGHGLRRRLLAVAILVTCVVTLLLAVPGLRPVVSAIAHMNPALVVGAVVLELASCLGFVVIFRLFFDPVPARVSRRLAWVEMGSGALLPGGGLGSLAVGGWLLHLFGMPTRQIVRRSSGLFFLTSAINVLALAVASLILLLGIGRGPHDALRAGLPVLAAVGVSVFVLVLPRLTRGAGADRPGPSWISDVGAGIPSARRELAHPSWRLLGAIGYLLFDIAVLWILFAAVGPVPPAAPLIVAYLLGYLANAIPIPGGVGVLDAGLVGALALYGLPVTHAAAAVLVYHAIAFWIPSLGGSLGYAALRRHPSLRERDGSVGGSRASDSQAPARTAEPAPRARIAPRLGSPSPPRSHAAAGSRP
jgi:uncharacterized membrane protein YbhN (UPF0104 family)